MTNITKKYNTLWIIFAILSFGATFFPITFYIIKAFISNATTEQKVTLVSTIMIALIFTILNLLLKFHIRSTIWILFLGVYICLDDIINMVFIIAVCTILDEFIFSPLAKHFKQKKIINKEIDKRI